MKRALLVVGSLVVGVLVLVALVAVSFPNDAFVQVDAAAPNAPRSERALQPGEELSAELRVSRIGLSRIDLDVAASDTRSDRLELELRAGVRGPVLVSRTVVVPRTDGTRRALSVTFDTITPKQAPRVELVLRNEADSESPIGIGVVDCPCVASAAWTEPDRTDDPDVVTFASVASGRDRLAEGGRRIDQLHGGWIGTKAMIFGSVLALLALAAIMVLALVSSLAGTRHESNEEERPR